MQDYAMTDGRAMRGELTRLVSSVVAMSAGCGLAVSAILIALAALLE
jgi:hypothetical protein